jgi:hypothetical protein
MGRICDESARCYRGSAAAGKDNLSQFVIRGIQVGVPTKHWDMQMTEATPVCASLRVGAGPSPQSGGHGVHYDPGRLHSAV